MAGFTCTKCGGTKYSRNEIRTEGGLLSAAFDVSTNRVPGAGSKVFDFLVS